MTQPSRTDNGVFHRATRPHPPGGFRRFSYLTARALGSPWAFALSLLGILLWLLLGPAYRYSDAWQLLMNTATSLVTFLMVFVIQNTQNRDATAMHLKLDELIRAVRGARTSLVRLEEMEDEELEQLEAQFKMLQMKSARRREAQTAALGQQSPALHGDPES